MAISQWSDERPDRHSKWRYFAVLAVLVLTGITCYYLTFLSRQPFAFVIALGPPIFAARAARLSDQSSIRLLGDSQSTRRMARGSTLEERLAKDPIRSHSRRMSRGAHLSTGVDSITASILVGLRSSRS